MFNIISNVMINFVPNAVSSVTPNIVCNVIVIPNVIRNIIHIPGFLFVIESNLWFGLRDLNNQSNFFECQSKYCTKRYPKCNLECYPQFFDKFCAEF